MSRWNVGDIPPVTADEDTDPDVEIAEREIVVVVPGKSARQLIEEREDEHTPDV